MNEYHRKGADMSFSTSLRTRTVPAVIAASVLGNLILIGTAVTTVGNALPGGIPSRLYLFYGLFGIFWPLCLGLLTAFLLKGPCLLLKQLIADAEEIASGRLRISADERSAGETGLLAGSMKRMVGSLNETLSGVIVSSNRLFSSEATLDMSAERLAANAGEQSEKAHQIAAAAEEMSQTITEIARQAADASDTSSQAVKIVTEGKMITEGAVSTAQTVFDATRELAATIERLNASILEIGNFVTVIEGIADQTNLLALNAAIEAARSGEHGRGFAVVADEVRNLATKTIQATAEISAKIRAVENESAKTAASMDEASKEVIRTTESIEQVGGSLDRIADAFHEVNDRITRMAAAVEQQSATTREVAAGIENTSRLSAEMGKMAIGVEQEVKVLGGITDELLVALGKLRLEAHEKTREIIEKIAESPELLSMDRSRQEAYMRRMLQAYPFIDLLYVTDAGGRQVTSNISASSAVSTSYGTDGYGMDWSTRPWFTGAKERSGSCITDLYRSAATDTFCFTISNLFKDTADRPKGVLGADIDFQRLCRSI